MIVDRFTQKRFEVWSFPSRDNLWRVSWEIVSFLNCPPLSFHYSRLRFIKLMVSLIGKLPRCLRERQFALGWHDIAVARLFAPECTTDGKYELVQCHPSSGFCWCSDKDGHVYSGTKVRGKPDCSNLPGKLPLNCWFSSFSVNSISLLLPINPSTLQSSFC